MAKELCGYHGKRWATTATDNAAGIMFSQRLIALKELIKLKPLLCEELFV